MLGSPLGGLHGEHLIVRADVEDEIGWDYPDTVIEDAYFGMEFKRYPGRATTLNSYSYGASPSSIRDLVRQRRRWIEGLLRLIVNPTLSFRTKIPLAYSVFTWALAPFQFVGLVLLMSYVTGVNNTSPVSPWLIPLWSISLAWVFWVYFEGLKVNLAASERSEGFLRNARVADPVHLCRVHGRDVRNRARNRPIPRLRAAGASRKSSPNPCEGGPRGGTAPRGQTPSLRSKRRCDSSSTVRAPLLVRGARLSDSRDPWS